MSVLQNEGKTIWTGIKKVCWTITKGVGTLGALFFGGGVIASPYITKSPISKTSIIVGSSLMGTPALLFGGHKAHKHTKKRKAIKKQNELNAEIIKLKLTNEENGK